MRIDLAVLVTIWVVMALILVALALYRKLVSRRGDDILHVRDSEMPLISDQVVIGKRLDWIDRWGKVATMVLIVYGLAIAAAYLYTGWQASAKHLYSVQ